MKGKKITAGILSTTALVFGGVDASTLNEVPLERVEMVAENRVEAKQIENVVETTLPWKDQSGIKVKYDMGEPTLAEKVKDKRKKEVITETVTDFDGGFKVDILLNEKPNTNVFCYAIEGSENYDFFYQPPLTEQEKAEGASRPPEIEGSYAVYHKTLMNHEIGKENYATGKVMHIPRPQVWSMSDVDTKVWADMNYEAGQLCVTVPQDFLNGAEYPVRIDPTFGYTGIGGTNSSFGANTIRGQEYDAPGAGILSKLTLYNSYVSGAGSPGLRGVVYNVDASDALLSFGGEVVTPTSPAQWNDLDVTDVTIVAGNTYLLSVWLKDPTAGNLPMFYYDVTGQLLYRDAETYSAVTDPPSTFSRDTTADLRLSLYATYEFLPPATLRINNGTLRINNGTLDL